MEIGGVFTLLLVFGFLSFTVWLDYRKSQLKIKSGRANLWDKWFGVGDISMSGDGTGPDELTKELAELRQHNKKLAERVEVLERIVTDSGFELEQQIRKL
ncbi:hypothetical protein [Ferrimonas lipolytica]|uniref:Phage shock protein B n=1 Tax=Ferrimonas lipolytica TaxID=2724191 RepID=A0A6H1UF63_9GAMM|nr:hypothetical protein [Ferrimonas lipolytica]QIZ77737.1 hypothetical protein HER31_13020 [Ferrimonas lipolytica]